MRDHDALGGDFIHWGIAHIDPELVGSRRARSMFLPVAAKPPGAVLGLNSFGSLGHAARVHHQDPSLTATRSRVYALGQPSMLKIGFSTNAVTTIRVLATGRLSGVYARR